MVKPIRVLPVISILSLVTVEYGGYALLGFLSGGGLNGFQHDFFRAGHAHAGVLLVLSLVYFLYLDRTDFSPATQWLAGVGLLVGILAQSGGFFVHMALGQPRAGGSAGTVLTTIGALLIAAALITLAVGLIRARGPIGSSRPVPSHQQAQ
jgi:hypothetical protein